MPICMHVMYMYMYVCILLHVLLTYQRHVVVTSRINVLVRLLTLARSSAALKCNFEFDETVGAEPRLENFGERIGSKLGLDSS